MSKNLLIDDGSSKIKFHSFNKDKFISDCKNAHTDYDHRRLSAFFEKYGESYYQKTEPISKDIITFRLTPNAYQTFYKDDELLMKIGYVENVCGTILQFYMSQIGAVYSVSPDDSSKQFIKIAENEKELFDYMMTVEYDYHLPISEKTYECLRNAGWYENRKVDISFAENGCRKAGYELSYAQKKFLEEFSGIKGHTHEGYEFQISADEECYNMPRSYEEPIYVDWGIGIVYVGKVAFCGNIYITLDGKMLIDEPGAIYGRTIMEGFEFILKNAKRWN